MTIPKMSSVFDHHDGPELSEFEPTKTRQEFLEESDINNIVEQYEHEGILIPEGQRQPLYGDFTAPELSNYVEAQNTVLSARELFEALPARVRERFGNDPTNIILFVQDERNREEAIELGLINKPAVAPAPAPAPVPPVTVTTLDTK